MMWRRWQQGRHRRDMCVCACARQRIARGISLAQSASVHLVGIDRRRRWAMADGRRSAIANRTMARPGRSPAPISVAQQLEHGCVGPPASREDHLSAPSRPTPCELLLLPPADRDPRGRARHPQSRAALAAAQAPPEHAETVDAAGRGARRQKGSHRHDVDADMAGRAASFGPALTRTHAHTHTPGAPTSAAGTAPRHAGDSDAGPAHGGAAAGRAGRACWRAPPVARQAQWRRRALADASHGDRPSMRGAPGSSVRQMRDARCCDARGLRCDACDAVMLWMSRRWEGVARTPRAAGTAACGANPISDGRGFAEDGGPAWCVGPQPREGLGVPRRGGLCAVVRFVSSACTCVCDSPRRVRSAADARCVLRAGTSQASARRRRGRRDDGAGT